MLRDLAQPSHLLILVLIVVVLFGGRRLPDAARGIGRSLRIFKSEIKQMNDDSANPPPAAQAPSPLEGRVMSAGSERATAATEQQAAAATEQRAAAATEQRRDA